MNELRITKMKVRNYKLVWSEALKRWVAIYY